jgi:hypothetical protein
MWEICSVKSYTNLPVRKMKTLSSIVQKSMFPAERPKWEDEVKTRIEYYMDGLITEKELCASLVDICAQRWTDLDEQEAANCQAL